MNQTQKGNLLKLARYLERLPEGYEHFDMTFYVKTRRGVTMGTESVSEGINEFTQEVQDEERSCGTVACAAGHGPMAGIAALKYEQWGDYIERSFGLGGDGEFYWCFGSIWRGIDNTPQGAAKRIKWMLKNGVPKNWERQQRGIVPLCYLEGEPA